MALLQKYTQLDAEHQLRLGQLELERKKEVLDGYSVLLGKVRIKFVRVYISLLPPFNFW